MGCYPHILPPPPQLFTYFPNFHSKLTPYENTGEVEDKNNNNNKTDIKVDENDKEEVKNSLNKGLEL